MRLLNTATPEDGVFEIREFNDEDVPPYAILSHTWGADEVTFRDMHEDVHVTEKKGYTKIHRCCGVAAREGLAWLWIDTCCIDKTSSAELSETINSMYRWYEESEVCYAFLEDVWAPAPVTDSRWFTRGFTLQELIAPGLVKFLDAGWKEVGTKDSLKEVISTRTGIPETILSGEKDLDTMTIAQRMSWAAHRKTSRLEDRAYCLLGIFDINIPLIYGEGHKAFIRLQEELMRTSDDTSLFAWRSERENHGGLLASSPEAFAGCSDIIIPDRPPISTENPWMGSNRGLQLDLPFLGVDEPGFGLAILQCTRLGKEDCVLAIYLRDLNLTLKNFERVSPAKVELMEIDKFHPAQFPVRRIYVRQQGRARASKHGQTKRASHVSLSTGRSYESFYEIFRLRDAETNLRQAGPYAMLWDAASLGDASMIQLIGCKDIDINAKDGQGRTALSLAAMNGQSAVVWLLLCRNDTEIAPRDNAGLIPLQYAARQPNTSVLEILLLRTNARYYKDDSGRSPLSHAAEYAQTAAAEMLIARSMDPEEVDSNGWTPLFWAIHSGSYRSFELFLSHTQDINHKDYTGRSALWYAVERGQEDVCQQLIDCGARVESAQHGPVLPLLCNAAVIGHVSMCQLLLANGVNVDSEDTEGRTALWYAIERGRRDLANILIEYGARRSLKDGKNVSALFSAEKNGYSHILKGLTYGGDIESTDIQSRTALRRAVDIGDEYAVNILVHSGANLNAKDRFGRTPLHAAASKGFERAVEILVQKADLDLKDKKGKTPLHLAVEGRFETTVKILIAKGADCHSKDLLLRTPLKQASAMGATMLATVLSDRS